MYISHFLLIVANNIAYYETKTEEEWKTATFSSFASNQASNDILMEESKIDEIQTTFGRKDAKT